MSDFSTWATLMDLLTYKKIPLLIKEQAMQKIEEKTQTIKNAY